MDKDSDAQQSNRPNTINLEYEVDKILARKNSKTGLMYYVKWKGYDISQATWEPFTHLINSIQAVKDFEKKCFQEPSHSHEEQNQGLLNQRASEKFMPKKKKRIFKQDKIFQRFQRPIKLLKNESRRQFLDNKSAKIYEPIIQRQKKQVILIDQNNQDEQSSFYVNIQEEQQQQTKKQINVIEIEDNQLQSSEIIDEDIQKQVLNQMQQQFSGICLKQPNKIQYEDSDYVDSENEDNLSFLKNLNPHLQQLSNRKKSLQVQTKKQLSATSEKIQTFQICINQIGQMLKKI